MLVGWVLSTLVRAVITRLLAKITMDNRLTAEAGMAPVGDSIGNILFRFVILLFITLILSALAIDGLLRPTETLINQILAMVPYIFSALVIGSVGYVIARTLRGIVASLLLAAGIDKHASKVTLSALAGTLVFIFVFFPAMSAALDALKVLAISSPAIEMLGKFLSAIPDIFAASVILGLSYFVAKFISGLLTRLLEGIGVDRIAAAAGYSNLLGQGISLSGLTGKLALFFAMLFATVGAANRIGFSQVHDVVTIFIKFSGDVLLGSVILGVGFWLANIARIAILGLVIAMGLRAMGIADDIVNLAFGLTLGAIALALALSFGLGGREAAGRQMEYWLSKLRKV